MITINEQLAQEFYKSQITTRESMRDAYPNVVKKGFTGHYRTFCNLVTRLNWQEQIRVARLTPSEKNPATQLPCGCSCSCGQGLKGQKN
jgi:hypothetical protein